MKSSSPLRTGLSTVGLLRSAGALPVEVPLSSRLFDEPSLDRGGPLRGGADDADPSALFRHAQQPRRKGPPPRAARRHRALRDGAGPMGDRRRGLCRLRLRRSARIDRAARGDGRAHASRSIRSPKSHVFARRGAGGLRRGARGGHRRGATRVDAHDLQRAGRRAAGRARSPGALPPEWLERPRRTCREAPATQHWLRWPGREHARTCPKEGATCSSTSRRSMARASAPMASSSAPSIAVSWSHRVEGFGEGYSELGVPTRFTSVEKQRLHRRHHAPPPSDRRRRVIDPRVRSLPQATA